MTVHGPGRGSASFDFSSNVRAAAGRHEPTSGPAVLEFVDVVRHFYVGGEAVRAVDGVSLRIEPGTLVALYGPSGSGKSTLLRLAAGIEVPDSGSVRVDGLDLAAVTEKESCAIRMRSMGWIGQDFDLLPGVSAVDNAAFKFTCAGYRTRAARRAAAELLESVGFGPRLRQHAETLSKGEAQRVVIARALALNPRVLLADEPTGNLDSHRTAAVLELLREITHARNLATLLVTHNERAASYADRVLVLQDGTLQETPTPVQAEP